MNILYQDSLICILNPNVKKGILIYTNYKQPKNTKSLCEIGLKTGKLLHEEGIDFGMIVYHPYIFFRAPFYSNSIDYSSIESEIYSSYGNINLDNKIFIRVVPNKTCTFSSEIRANYSPPYYFNSPQYINRMEMEVNNSKKLLTDYLSIIDSNSKVERKNGYKYLYNLFSSYIYECQISWNSRYPFDYHNINENSEILCSKQYLPHSFFVKCD